MDFDLETVQGFSISIHCFASEIITEKGLFAQIVLYFRVTCVFNDILPKNYTFAFRHFLNPLFPIAIKRILIFWIYSISEILMKS